MQYVEHLNIFGIEAKQIPCIVASGGPTSATEGAVGCLYMDSDTGALYKCTAVVNGVFTWEKIGTFDDGQYFDDVAPENLLNIDAAELGVGILPNGTRYTKNMNNCMLTDFIPVSAGETLYHQLLNLNTNARQLWRICFVCAYDSDKSVVSSAGADYVASDVFSYTVPEGISFVRFTLMTGNQYTDHALVLSEKILPYVEYTTQKLKQKYLDIDSIVRAVKADSKDRKIALPYRMYGFVGYPVILRFQNVIGNNINDVYIKNTNNYGAGNQYADRWEYLPTEANTLNGSVKVYNHDYEELNNHTLQVVIKDSTQKSNLKVLVIGDSTVNAGFETQKMLNLATADGYGLTLLGGRGTAPNLHEGRNGWTAYRYANQSASASGAEANPFYNPSVGGFDFSYYMTQKGYNGVDCVFLQLGVNDVFTVSFANIDAAVASYIDNMERIINSIHAYDSNIKIIVNLISPCNENQDKFAELHGTYYTTWISRKNIYEANIALLDKFATTTNVYLSAFNAVIDASQDVTDDVHPTQTGYEQLGTQMYSCMRAIN